MLNNDKTEALGRLKEIRAAYPKRLHTETLIDDMSIKWGLCKDEAQEHLQHLGVIK